METGTADQIAEYYDAVVVQATDYYPFGMEMPGRSVNVSSYRYGFNGKERDGDGEFGGMVHYDYGWRVYNAGLGRFLSVDPLAAEYPWYTPYQFAGNKPIKFIDLDGLEPEKNPMDLDFAQLFGKDFVSRISGYAAENHYARNSETPIDKQNLLGVVGQRLSEEINQIGADGRSYTTDTDNLSGASQYNMYVSTNEAFYVDESNAANF